MDRINIGGLQYVSSISLTEYCPDYVYIVNDFLRIRLFFHDGVMANKGSGCDGIILSKFPMPPQSAEHFRTIILKVGSNGEIVREIKRNQQLNSHRTVAGAAPCNPKVDGWSSCE